MVRKIIAERIVPDERNIGSVIFRLGFEAIKLINRGSNWMEVTDVFFGEVSDLFNYRFWELFVVYSVEK